MTTERDTEPWYSWRRKPNRNYIKKWSIQNPEVEARWASFSSDPAVCPNNKWRDNDVFVSTFMRSGQTEMKPSFRSVTFPSASWTILKENLHGILGAIMNSMLVMIVQRSADPIQDLMLDSHTCFKLYKEDNKQSDLPVRVLSGHELPAVLSPEVILNGNRKFICIRRNPKDVLTSLSFFIKRNSGIYKEMPLQDDFVDDWCNNGAQACASSWYHHVRAWEQFIQEHPKAKILPMMYEDFVLYPERCIKEVANFLSIELDAKVVRDIAEATRFAKLVATPSPDVTDAFVAGDELPIFYRKGVVGDWKNLLTVSQSEMIDAATERLMEGSNLKFTYE